MRDLMLIREDPALEEYPQSIQMDIFTLYPVQYGTAAQPLQQEADLQVKIGRRNYSSW